VCQVSGGCDKSIVSRECDEWVVSVTTSDL